MGRHTPIKELMDAYLKWNVERAPDSAVAVGPSPGVPSTVLNSSTEPRRNLRLHPKAVCSTDLPVCIVGHQMATHVRKNITLPRSLDERLRKAARKRGTTQSGLIGQLVETGLAAGAAQIGRMGSFVGVVDGPRALSATMSGTLYC